MNSNYFTDSGGGKVPHWISTDSFNQISSLSDSEDEEGEGGIGLEGEGGGLSTFQSGVTQKRKHVEEPYRNERPSFGSFKAQKSSAGGSDFEASPTLGLSVNASGSFYHSRIDSDGSESPFKSPTFGDASPTIPGSTSGSSFYLNRTDSDDSEPTSIKPNFEFSSAGEGSPRKKKQKFGTTGVHRASLDTPIINNKGFEIMAKTMGWKRGEGLGKESQGRVDPVALSNQKGRHGIGHTVRGLDEAVTLWEESEEDIQVVEHKEWLDNPSHEYLDIDTLRQWKKEDTKCLDMETMTEFCDANIVKGVLKAKKVFDDIIDENLRKARSKSNPFETIGRGIFLNRAAMKMANIDAAFNFMFTSPLYEDRKSMIDKDLLYFADVCAGPGGFSEYVLWKKKWKAKGIGFTLKNECDFKLHEFFSGPSETFEPYYGEKGDGNIYDPQNITSLTDFVMDVTNNVGVHFMMADGGFSVENQENIQELLSKQLYLTQFLVALSIVRNHGHFVCKLFDLFSPFSAGLIYLMYRSFRRICIFKPNSSRPANSERYIICKWKRDNCDAIRQYMFELNDTLNELGQNSNTDVTECVPISILKSDKNFYNYLMTSNNSIGKRQIVSLSKIAAFYVDPNLEESKQDSLRIECLKKWQIPDRIRKAEDRTGPDDAIKKIFGTDYSTEKSVLWMMGKKLRPDTLENAFVSVYDWNCIVLGCEENNVHFYLCVSKGKIYKYKSTSSRWEEVPEKFELLPGTLVYGEIVNNLIGEGAQQCKLKKLHIYDAVSLGYDEKIWHLHYNDRYELCCKYETALRKKQRKPDYNEIKVMAAIPLENCRKIFESLTFRVSKKKKPELLFEGDVFSYLPKGVLIFKVTKEPWSRTVSKKSKQYYYHAPNQESQYEEKRPDSANASVKDCLQSQLIWWWEDGIGIYNESPKKEVISRTTFLDHVKSKLVFQTNRQ